MKDAFGTTFSLTMIFLFIILLAAILAYNVNYAKAFRIKNFIVDKFEQYGSTCEANGSTCKVEIGEAIRNVGYVGAVGSIFAGGGGAGNLVLDDEFGYAYERHDMGVNPSSGCNQIYYDVYTTISIEVPILTNWGFLGNLITVRGTTKTVDVC